MSRLNQTNWTSSRIRLNSALIGASIACMAAARVIAVLVAAFLSTAVAAQEPAQAPQEHLSIKIVDSDGTFVPGAQVVVDHGNTAITDSGGNATVDLSMGKNVIRVLKSGYENAVIGFHIQRIEANFPGQFKIILYKIDDPCRPPGICVAQSTPWLLLESVDIAESIPLQPLRNFGPLPLDRPKHHW
jgi:hypothetical protein